MAKFIVVHSVRVCTEFVPETYGRLTTIGPAFRLSVLGRYVSKQVCACTCGGFIAVLTGALRNGNTRSCGCLARETAAKTLTTHGKSKTIEHVAYCHMLARCHNGGNKQFKDYGGRGIKVHSAWVGHGGFERWLSHIGPRPSPGLSQDRYPNTDGDYEPGNVRWATAKEQCNNKTNNHKLTHNGITMTVSQWAAQTGIKYQTIQSRIRLGWNDSRILTTPAQKRTS